MRVSRPAMALATILAWLAAGAACALAAQGTAHRPDPAPLSEGQVIPASYGPAATGPVDYVFVEKAARRLSLWSNGWLVRTYPVKLGGAPVGDKVREGDGRTPEGLYSIAYRNPQSRFHLSLMTSYPDARDRARAANLGVSPGGQIAIHGLPNDGDKTRMTRIHQYVDWTDGCIAVTDGEIEEIFALVEPGTPIEIVP
jgi:murein L,D-transpeptidase YafK